MALGLKVSRFELAESRKLEVLSTPKFYKMSQIGQDHHTLVNIFWTDTRATEMMCLWEHLTHKKNI